MSAPQPGPRPTAHDTSQPTNQDASLPVAACPEPLSATLPGDQPDLACLTLPGQSTHVRDARHWLARLLTGHPAAEDAALALAELATNAVLHSNSRLPGGTFTVRAGAGPDMIRLEVTDAGGPWADTQPAHDGQCGRGLAIVAAIATAWGISGNQTGRTAWCELHE